MRTMPSGELPQVDTTGGELNDPAQRQRREERFRVIDRVREAFKDVPSEEIEREVDRALAELRGKTACQFQQVGRVDD